MESSAEFVRVEPWVSAQDLEATCLANVSWAARQASLRSLVLEHAMDRGFGFAGHHGMLRRLFEIAAEAIETSSK